MSVIERKVYVCDVHGETANVVAVGAGPGKTEPWCVECQKPAKVVRLVPDDVHRGAVDLLDALDRYVGHREDCNLNSGAPECSCGFEDLYVRVRATVRRGR